MKKKFKLINRLASLTSFVAISSVSAVIAVNTNLFLGILWCVLLTIVLEIAYHILIKEED